MSAVAAAAAAATAAAAMCIDGAYETTAAVWLGYAMYTLLLRTHAAKKRERERERMLVYGVGRSGEG